MNAEGYLILSNVITGFIVIATCAFTACRRPAIFCPYCNEALRQSNLRPHLDICMRMSATAVTVVGGTPAVQRDAPLAVAVPLPPAYYVGTARVADV